VNKNKIKINSNRSFGIVFFVVFLIVGLWPILSENDIRIWSIILSLIFLILGLLNSKLLTPLNKVWFKFGIALGSIVAPIVMGLIFFMVVTPISLLMKLFNKDVLNLKKNNNKSYWILRNQQKSRMKDQF
jgi:nitrate reductase NapE component